MSVTAPPSLYTDGQVIIPENPVDGYQLLTLTGYDDGPVSDLTISLVTDAGGRFAIQDGFLIVTDGSLFDYETQPEHSVVIRVADALGAFRDYIVTIYLTDIAGDQQTPPPPPVDNADPLIVRLQGDWVTEGSNSNITVGWVKAVDPDGYALTYSLIDDAGGRFQMIGNRIVVANGSLIDYEDSQTHQITVLVTDPHGGATEQTFTIRVTDRPGDEQQEPETPPPNQAPSTIILDNPRVAENAYAGTPAGTLRGIDPDGDIVTFTLIDDAGGRFYLDGNVVRVAPGAQIDYEQWHSHTIRVLASDGRGGYTEADMAIYVVNDVADDPLPPPPPGDHTGTQGNDVLRGTSASESFLGLGGDDILIGGGGYDFFDGGAGDDAVIGGTSGDAYHWEPLAGDYDYISDEGGTNDSLYIHASLSDLTFHGSPSGGDLRIVHLPTGAILDIGQYFNTSSLGGQIPGRIEYVAFADAELTFEQIVALLTDQPSSTARPTNIVLDHNGVEDGAGNGTLVGLLSTLDPQGGGNFTYELIDGAGGRFAIQGDRIVVANGALIDYETAQYHWIRVKTTDSTGLSVIKSFSILVTDDDAEDPLPPENHAPSDIVMEGGYVSEIATGGTLVAIFHATDPDGDALTYSIPTDNDIPFVLVGNKLVLKQGTVLDYDTQSSYDISIMVTDSHGAVRIDPFTINVLDVIVDPTPTGPIVVVGTEGSETLAAGLPHPAGYQLYGLGGDDVLLGGIDNDTLEGGAGNDMSAGGLGDDTYIWLPGGIVDYIYDEGGNDTVQIGEVAANLSFTRFSGDLRITTALGTYLSIQDYFSNSERVETLVFADGTVWHYENVLEAAVSQEPPPPTNHLPSDITLSNTVIAENTVSGTLFARISANDPDGDQLTYAIVGPHGGAFRLVGNELVVADASKLDFETNPVQTISISATDSRGGVAVQTFEIEVTDVDESEDPPLPPANHAPTHVELTDYSVLENTETGTVVSLLRGHDPDGDALTYSLVSPNSAFAIQGDELIVADSSALDYESGAFHTLIIRATDAHGAFVDQVVTIAIEDEVDESLPGSDEADILTGGLGNDELFGFGGNDQIAGAAGHDTLDGGTGQDRLFGGSGHDVLMGGAGKDTLTGGAGKDAFVFSTAINSAQADRITDFSVRDDTIHLSKAIFKKAGPLGTLKADAFVVAAQAQDAEDRIIYNKTNGKLFYDADGNGAKAAVHFATIKAELNLTHKDFLII